MKSCALFLVVCLAISVKSDPDMAKVIQTCKDSVGVSDEDLAKVLSFAKPENKSQKCMFSCLMTSMGLVMKSFKHFT